LIVKRWSWFGAGLIVLGIAMLLDRLEIVRFDWHIVLWALLAIVGLVKGMDGFSKKKTSRVFWGTFLFLLGAYNLLRGIDAIELRSYWWLPAMMLMLGFSLLMMFVCSPREWHLLVPALVLLGVGAAILLTEFGYFYRYDVAEAIRMYWPITLILFGLSLVLQRSFPRSRR
jgi:hypothetical protein